MISLCQHEERLRWAESDLVVRRIYLILAEARRLAIPASASLCRLALFAFLAAVALAAVRLARVVVRHVDFGLR